MSTVFDGRLVLGGPTEGRALVTNMGFNPLAAFCDAIVDGAAEARCADAQNPGLFGKDLEGAMLCAPSCVGSTTAGPVWEYVADTGIAPGALLLAGPVDSLTAGGLVLTEVWIGRPITLVDRLGERFLAMVREGDRVEVREDGTVAVHSGR
jgi:predicted aconitase with swiveling domain